MIGLLLCLLFGHKPERPDWMGMNALMELSDSEDKNTKPKLRIDYCGRCGLVFGRLVYPPYLDTFTQIFMSPDKDES